MRKSGVEHPERLFRSRPNVSLVIVRASIPAGVTTKDKFDVEIELPPASATTSLAGGWLVATQLAQRAMTKEGEKDDKVIAVGRRPDHDRQRRQAQRPQGRPGPRRRPGQGGLPLPPLDQGGPPERQDLAAPRERGQAAVPPDRGRRPARGWPSPRPTRP